MWLRTICQLRFDIQVATPFVFMLRPRSGAQQWVAREEYHLSQGIYPQEYTDGYGNLCQRLVASPGSFEVSTRAEVMTADTLDRAHGTPFTLIQDLPEQVLVYLLPSRYCESDRFNALAMDIVAGLIPGYDQVAAIVDWVHQNIDYTPGSSVEPLSASEVRHNGHGVCRDLAHMGIALCRSLSIPARMVVGYRYALEPMDMHAWFEAYVGDRWYTFDPTQSSLEGGYVAVAYGRDAADVALYTLFGPVVFASMQYVDVELLRGRF